jgi:hypothetical protein
MGPQGRSLAKTKLGQLQVGTKLLRLMSQAKPDIPAIDHLAAKHTDVAAWAMWEPYGYFDPGALANELTDLFHAEALPETHDGPATDTADDGALIPVNPLSEVKIHLPNTARERVTGLRASLQDHVSSDPATMGKLTVDFWGKLWAKADGPETEERQDSYLDGYMQERTFPPLTPERISLEIMEEAMAGCKGPLPGPTASHSPFTSASTSSAHPSCWPKPGSSSTSISSPTTSTSPTWSFCPKSLSTWSPTPSRPSA